MDTTPATECFGPEESGFKFGDLKPSAIGYCDPTATEGTTRVTGSDNTMPSVTGSNSDETTPIVTGSTAETTTDNGTGGVTIVKGTFLAILVAICVSFYHRV